MPFPNPQRLSRARGFLLDMDGTFYLGDRLVEGALRFIEVIGGQGKNFLFLTNNSSKNAAQYAEKLGRLGLDCPQEKVLTSGEATALYLRDRHPDARLYVVGTPALEDEFLRHGFSVGGDSPEAVVLGFDTGLTYARLWRLCDLVRAGLPYIATHPDLNCPTENGPMPDIGATIAFVHAATGRRPDLVVGKPNRLILEAASRKLGLALDALVMIGDRLYTDIAMGASGEIVTVLVLSGETKRADIPASHFRPDFVFENLGQVAEWLEENRQDDA